MPFPATELFGTTWLGDDADVALHRWGDHRELHVSFSDGSFLVVRCGGGGRRSTARRGFERVRRRVERRARERTAIRLRARRGRAR